MPTALAKRDRSEVDLAHYDAADAARAIDAIETAVGGRAAVVAALTLAPETDDLAYVIRLIADPSQDTRDLSAICRAGGVKIGEIIHALKQGLYARMLIQTTATITSHSPAVVEDIMVRAQQHYIDCPTCRGTLLIYDRSQADPRNAPKIPCDACENPDGIPTGKVLVYPDLDRQKVALDLANLLPKKTAPSVVVDNRSVSFGDASPEGLDRLLAATDDILYRSRRRDRPSTTVSDPDSGDVVDADPAPPSGPPADDQ